MVLHIQHASEELLREEGGSLYPALHRMGRVGGCVTAAHTVTNRKPKFYKLTPQGRHQLQRAEESFDQLVKGVRNSLRYA
jgi:DNA-binding PadR family transcriptional regulator